MLNAITMLKSDHVQVKRLLRQLEQIGDRAVKDRERLVAGIRSPRSAAVSAAGPPASGRLSRQRRTSRPEAGAPRGNGDAARAR
jgi:hypothetical protein